MSSQINVLLADDDAVLRKLIPAQLRSEEFNFSTVASGADVMLALAENDFDVILLDNNLPDTEGVDLLPSIAEITEAPEVIMLTADTTLTTGIQAMRRGAYDYVTKPADTAHLQTIIRKAAEKHALIKQNERLKAVVSRQSDIGVIEPVHESSLMRQIFSRAERIAKIDSTVLITGESGTGKDVLARWIHRKSNRADSPLLSVNCGALPENLFESEFFGHEKGAFTGANQQRAGLIEASDGSTLFLDEIGEMPLSMQVKLLQFLENGEFRRVGATRARKADVRIIAATNRDLAEEVRAERFRLDLFYRLNVISFNIPPLRERKEDLTNLIEFFLLDLRKRFARPSLKLGRSAVEQALTNTWNGNIRELRNVLERSAALSSTDEINELVGLASTGSKAQKNDNDPSTLLSLAELEKRQIFRALDASNGNKEKAAVILGVTSRTLYRKLKEYKIS